LYGRTHQSAPDQLAMIQVLPGPTGSCQLRELAYGTPTASRELRLVRYAHARVRRSARAQDGRILERVQNGLASAGAASGAGPIAMSEVGLLWFVECLRAARRLPQASPVRQRACANRRRIPEHRCAALSPAAAAGTDATGRATPAKHYKLWYLTRACERRLWTRPQARNFGYRRAAPKPPIVRYLPRPRVSWVVRYEPRRAGAYTVCGIPADIRRLCI
jgi:hypothetical protein